MEEWNHSCFGVELGKIEIMPSTERPSVSLRLGGSSKFLPMEYSVEVTPSLSNNTVVFSESVEDAKAKRIIGMVQHECKALPLMNEEYRSIMRSRRVEAEKPKRMTQMFESSGSVRMVKNDTSFSLGQMPSRVKSCTCNCSFLFRRSEKLKISAIVSPKEKL